MLLLLPLLLLPLRLLLGQENDDDDAADLVSDAGYAAATDDGYGYGPEDASEFGGGTTVEGDADVAFVVRGYRVMPGISGTTARLQEQTRSSAIATTAKQHSS